MFLRMLRSIALAAGATVLVNAIPDIARYLRIRNPDPRPSNGVDGTDGVRNA